MNQLVDTTEDKKGFPKLLIIILLIIVVVAGYFMFFQKPTGSTEPTEPTNSLLIGDNAIFISDTKPATMVNVGFAIFAEGGYVVIHEDNEGKPGAIVGNSTMMSEGESRDFEILLSRESVDGEALYAMLHSDNNDGVFNPAEDSPIKDDQGNIILMKFQISSDATEPGAISL